MQFASFACGRRLILNFQKFDYMKQHSKDNFYKLLDGQLGLDFGAWQAAISFGELHADIEPEILQITSGIETSQYREEKKTHVISLVTASESDKRQTEFFLERGKRCGVS